MKPIRFIYSIYLILSIFTISETSLAQVNFWTQTSIDTGNIKSIGADSGGYIYAYVRYDGLYQSTNNGVTWSLTGLTTGIHPNLEVGSYAINSSNDIFVGTNGLGIYRSSDQGTSWVQMNTGLTNLVIYSLAINPAGHIFAATGAGIYYTENSGLTWIQTNFTNPTESIAIKSNGYIFAADVSGSVYRSTDNGVSWTNIPNGLSTATIILLAINHNGDVFAASFFGLYKTENDGNSWTHLIPINGMIHSLVINSIDHIFVGFDGGVSRSVNNGTNWEEINAGLTNPHVRSLGINIDGIIFAGTYDGGIFRSIESTTAIEDYNHEIVPTFVLEQNYPNPFNPVTNIGFRIADRGFVSLKVYDVTGREIVTLVAENLIPGDYQYRWDAEKFASGLYFYKITAGSFTKTRKMILIK
jgi:photosystem II stability/assembly factor-like uncharacterized protein